MKTMKRSLAWLALLPIAAMAQEMDHSKMSMPMDMPMATAAARSGTGGNRLENGPEAAAIIAGEAGSEAWTSMPASGPAHAGDAQQARNAANSRPLIRANGMRRMLPRGCIGRGRRPSRDPVERRR